jgi:hypothetical protein
MKGTMREGFFTGNPKRYVKQGSKWASAFIGAPLLGNMKGALLRTFLFRRIFMRFTRDMQNALSTGLSHHRDLEGVGKYI